MNRFLGFRRRGGTTDHDRGAGLVEYSLVIALLAVGSTATFDAMDDRVEDHYRDSAEDIGQNDLDYFEVSTTTTLPGTSSTTTTTTTTTTPPSSSTSSTTTTTTTTTTTVPPTTVPPTTVPTTTVPPTTVPPTTTAAPTTTTEPPAQQVDSRLRDRSGWDRNTRSYRARAAIRLTDDNGNRMRNAEVEVRFVLSDGTVGIGSATTNSSGNVTFTWNYLSYWDFPVQVTILNATDSSGDPLELDDTTLTLYP